MIGSISFGAPSQLPSPGMASASGARPAEGTGQAEAPAFGDVLKDYAASAAAALKTGEAAALAGIEGRIPLQTMVDQVLAAERTLQAAVAVRDKLVSSYLEISRMQI